MGEHMRTMRKEKLGYINELIEADQSIKSIRKILLRRYGISETPSFRTLQKYRTRYLRDHPEALEIIKKIRELV